MLRLSAAGLRSTAFAAVVSLAAAIGSADEIFDARGYNRNRDFFSQLPYEHIDAMTGNLLLTFTDLVLPGNAGFDLKIQRTYNSKIYRDQTFSTLDEDSWAGVGWSLHLGRVRNPNAAVPGPVEMPDGSAHKLFNHINGQGGFISRDYWLYNKNTYTLSLPNGLVYTFGRPVTLPSGQSFRYVTSIADPFGNTVEVAYMTTPADGILQITQNLGSQQRVINFTADTTTLRSVQTMTLLGRTWSYVHQASNAAGFSRLLSVSPPLGTGWTYTYETAASIKNELRSVSTPHGGVMQYTYSTVGFYLGSTQLINTRAVTQRTTSGPVSSGTWTYQYAQGSGRNETGAALLEQQIERSESGGLHYLTRERCRPRVGTTLPSW